MKWVDQVAFLYARTFRTDRAVRTIRATVWIVGLVFKTL